MASFLYLLLLLKAIAKCKVKLIAIGLKNKKDQQPSLLQ